MRNLAIAALLLLLTACASVSAQSGEPGIGRVWTEYRTAASFERIRDYFRQGSAGEDRRVIRTRDGVRDGYYFLLRVENGRVPLPDARIEISVIMPGSVEPRLFAFRTDVPDKAIVLNLGITGEDWPDARTRPLAWRIRLANAGGSTLAESHSFLWSDPAVARSE